MTYYIGFTIGPIYDTFKNSKATREIWAGSYLFSFYMKHLIFRLNKEGWEFLSPYVDAAMKDEKFLHNDKSGVGLYHDRFLVFVESDDVSELETVLNEAMYYSRKMIIDSFLEGSTDSIAKLENYLDENYIIVTEDELKKITAELDSHNEITALNHLLDMCELQKDVSLEVDENITIKNEITGDTVNCNPIKAIQVNTRKIRQYAFDENDDNRTRFPFVAQIAAHEFKKNNPWSDFKDDEYQTLDPYEYLRNKLSKVDVKNIRQFHKYMAVIQADGDGIGALIGKMVEKGNENLRKLSKSLFDFVQGDNEHKESLKQITKRFGGELIYAGGDDILAFIPVRSEQGTFLEYIDMVSDRFQNMMKSLSEEYDMPTASLSFGVSIAYHKFPLAESMEIAANNLFGISKQQNQKNIVTVSLTKNSGQSHLAILPKNNQTYTTFKELLGDVLSSDSEIPHSVHYNLARYEAVIKNMMEHEEGSVQFSQFLNYLFKSDLKGEIGFLDVLIKYVTAHKEEYQTWVSIDEDDEVRRKEKTLDIVYINMIDSMAIMKFLRGDR